MRRTPTNALAVAVLSIALALAGCASWFESPNKPANEAIIVANSHLTKAAAAGKSVSDAAPGLDSVPYTKKGATTALEITAKIKSDLATEKEELTAAKSATDSIAKMEVGEELKKYAALESTALETRIKVVDLGVKLYAQMDKFYVALQTGKTTTVDAQKILDGVETIERDITALSELAAQQSQAASDYFTAQKLGG
jgi:hypothetical protein